MATELDGGTHGAANTLHAPYGGRHHIVGLDLHRLIDIVRAPN